MDTDVIVIGAGAAGMMCAAQAGRRGRRVLLVDRATRIGERIRISGGGRCNFTNRHAGPDHYLSQNPRFCRSALAQFPPDGFLTFVAPHRLPWHEEEHGQLFCDRSSQDILALLRRECDGAGVRLVHPCKVARVERAAGRTPARSAAQQARFMVSTDRGAWTCRSLVVATGGLAVPRLGATPFGYELARQFGIPVVPPLPALVPLALGPETLPTLAPLAGVSFVAETRCGGPETPRFRDHALVTHRGLSGPAILQISTYWQMNTYGGGGRPPVVIDLLAGMDAHEWLDARRENRTTLPNLLAERLPKRLAQGWCALHGWTAPASQYGAIARRAIARALNAWTVTPSGTLGFAKAEVTLGGVDTGALSSRTMEARHVPGLFFIGEVVDVTGWLGGYNFQWAWSSG